MTNKENLKYIMAKYDLSNKQTAKFIGVSFSCIKAWKTKGTNLSFRNMEHKKGGLAINKLLEAVSQLESVIN